MVRDLHTHQEGRRESLRQKHADLYAEFEDVQAELEALSVELHTLTDLGVDLDANFSRYGYSAHIRKGGGAGWFSRLTLTASF